MPQPWSPDLLPSLSGHIALVTGANSGIGYETALALAKKEAHVVLACRDVAKAEQAQGRIRRAAPAAQVDILSLDLSRLASVADAAALALARYPRLDLLINNAGVMMPPYQQTEDGFERQFASNYLGHFALTGRLLPLLLAAPSARVISLSSLAFRWSELHFDNLNAQKGYSRRTAYGQSKRACLVFAYELHRRLQAAGHPIKSLAAHPGLAKTNLDQYFPALLRPLGSLFLQPAHMGALPTLYAALEPGLAGGSFVGPGGFQQMRGYPTLVEADANAKSPAIGKQLWQASEALSQVRYLSQ